MSYPVAYRQGAQVYAGFQCAVAGEVYKQLFQTAYYMRLRPFELPRRPPPRAVPLPTSYRGLNPAGPRVAGAVAVGAAVGLAVAAVVQGYKNIRDSMGADPLSWPDSPATPANYTFDGTVNNNAPHASYGNDSEVRWYNMSASNWSYYQTNGPATNWDQTFAGHINSPAYEGSPTSVYGIAQSTRRTRGAPSWPDRTAYSWHEIYEYTAGTPEKPATNQGLTEYPNGIPEIPPLPHVQPVMPEVLPANVPWSQVQEWRQIRDAFDPAGQAAEDIMDRRQPGQPRTDPAVGVQVVAVMPATGPVRIGVGPSGPHPTRPPRANERERKQKAATRMGIGFQLVNELAGRNVRKGLDNLTEALDWLNAIYFALPEEVRSEDPAFTPQEQLIAILTHLDQIELDTLVKNIVVMELTDRFLGRLSSSAQKGLGNAGFAGDFFGPVL